MDVTTMPDKIFAPACQADSNQANRKGSVEGLAALSFVADDGRKSRESLAADARDNLVDEEGEFSRRGLDSSGPAPRGKTKPDEVSRQTITLHRYSPALSADPHDLGWNELAMLWGLLKAENLVEVFFHDGHIRTLQDFTRFAANPGNWFYAAACDGVFIGIGVVNGFSSSGNTAYGHLVSFKEGRMPRLQGEPNDTPRQEGTSRAAERAAFRKEPGTALPGDERPARASAPQDAGPSVIPQDSTGPSDCLFAEAGRLWFELLRAGGLETVLAVIPGCYRGVRRWSESFGFIERMRLPGALRLVRSSGVRVTDAVVYAKSLV